MFHPNVGRKFLSPYFGDLIIVTRYKNDEDWHFRVKGTISCHQAVTRLSYFEKEGLEVHK